MYAGLAPYLGGRPLCGVQATGPGRDLTQQGLPDVFRDVAAHCLEGVRRAQPECPYRLCERYDGDVELCGAAADFGNLYVEPIRRPRTVTATRETA